MRTVMARDRKIFKVDEEKLKEMMASESISCRFTGSADISASGEDSTDIPEENKAEKTKARSKVCKESPLAVRTDEYRKLFLDRKVSVRRKQTYISDETYRKLARTLPLLGDDISVPAFLDNVLAHHLETYNEELGELFRRKTRKTF